MRRTGRFVVWALVAACALPAAATVTVYEKDDKKIDIGGRIQLEYVNFDPDCDSGVASCFSDDSGGVSIGSFDEFNLRRARLQLGGTVVKDWLAKVEVDFGESEGSNELQLRDFWFAYAGFSNPHNTLTIGNSKSVFARELLTSSTMLELVERGFTGDHNFGVPDRSLGVRWDTRLLDGKISTGVTAAAQNHDPAVNRMDFDTPVNTESDWNQGWVVAGRIDFHPLGYMPFSQGDLKRGKSKITLGLSGFSWVNDDDNNTFTDPMTGLATNPDKPDLDEAQGGEVSLAYRGHGFSFDATAQKVSGDTVDPTFTGGIYKDGTTDLDKLSFVGGFMVYQDKLEVVAGWDSQDADNYERNYERTSVGLNWYLKEYNFRVQATYRMVQNFIGLAGQDNNVLFVSSMFRF